MNKQTITVLSVAALTLCGCVAVPTSIAELRSSEPDRQEVISMPWRDLAGCYRDNVEATMRGPTRVDIDESAERASIFTGYSLFEVAPASEETSLVTSWPAGNDRWLHTQWIDLGRECEAGMLAS